MQRLPEDITVQDAQQWISRCAVYWGADGEKPELVFTGGVSETRRSISAVPLEEGRATIEVPLSLIWVHWPLTGCINTQHGALYVSRHAERQWRRAYSGRFVDIVIPWEWEAVKRRPPLAQYNGDHREVVKALFEPEYPQSTPEALERLEGKKAPGTVAVNRFIILSADRGVYYRGERIGSLDEYNRLVPTCGERMARRVEKYIDGGLAL